MKHRLLTIIALLFALSAQAVTHRALIIGLGKQEDPAWGKIHGDNDVYYVRQMLERMGYTDIRTLKNEQATKAAMVEAFRQLAQRCRRGDVVYVHYSGHGQLMTDLDGDEAERWAGTRHAQWDEAWIPYDAYMVYGPRDRGEKHLSDDEVARLLDAVRQRIGHRGELTVVVDACHSGDATCGPDDEPVRGVDMHFSIPRQPDGAPPTQATQERWRTISACKPYQLCTEIKAPQVGKLTWALYQMGAKAMAHGNKELQRRLDNFMKQHPGRLPQTPEVRGEK